MSLQAVLALARAGATDQAWRLLQQARSRGEEEAACLVLQGRLLKDRAAIATGEDRRRLFGEAARAYAEAAGTAQSSYPLINAATLSLLSGDREGAQLFAGGALQKIETHPEEPETPYYRAATRAEALLLLGREEEAQAAFREAVALAPRAWEDHASTLRQFALILAEQDRSAAWLDALRPPRSLHFGGHMAFAPDKPRSDLTAEVDASLGEERIGFGYGALAAGADIIVAEALLSRGAELHLILPGGTQAFAATSVDPFGAAWRARFDAVIAAAETVRPVPPLGATPDPATIAIADEIAMGAALMNAARLESEAVQLLVVDASPARSARSRSATARAQSLWAEAGRRQRLIRAPREAVAPGAAGAIGGSTAFPLAMLAVALDFGDGNGLTALQARFAGTPAPALAPYWAAGQVLTAYAKPADAAAAALRLASEGYGVGGHYGVAAPFTDPFSGGQRLTLGAGAAASAACASAPAGTACVTEDFAAALAAAGEGPRTELAGELDASDGGPPIALYALRRGS